MTKTNFRRSWSAIALGGALLAVPAGAQTLPGGGTLEPFGGGFSPERNIQLKVKDGPFQVVTGKFTLPPGGEVDWHDHPGTGLIIVTQGAFDEFRENGCVALHAAGDVFYEVQGEVHRVANASATEPAEGLITFFLPVGSNPVTFVPPPRERPCSPGNANGLDEQDAAELAEIKRAVDANSKAAAEIQNLLTRIARALSLNP